MADLRNYFSGRLGTSMKIDKKESADWVRAGDGQFTQIDPRSIAFRGKLTKHTPQNMDFSILLRDELNCTLLFFGKRVSANFTADEERLVITIPSGALEGSLDIYKKGRGTEINAKVFGGLLLLIYPTA